MTVSVRLTRRPLSLAAAARELAGPGLGGVVLFVGRVRPDRTPKGTVVALAYEADPARAVRRLREIGRTAERRFGARRLVLWHRLGRVPVDAPSVVVGAGAGHRAAAFAAARFAIEELKRRVPLWKADRVRRARPRRRHRGRPRVRSAG